MNRSTLDHLVVTAPSLAAGVEYVRGVLGVEPSPGGEQKLELTHPEPELIESVLKWIGFEGPVAVQRGESPSLQARLRTPEGMKTLA